MDKLPIDRPKYLLDLYKWEICLFDDCWNDYYRELKKNGYAAISYAWGKWKDRTEFAHDDPGAAPLYPTFNIGKDPKDTTKNLSWVFPIVRAQPGLPEEQFTIRDVRHTLNTMGLRYVWWDWACIPQGFVDPEKSQEFQIHEALRSVAEQEVNKMRYVYPHSKRGTIWAHNIRWSDDSALKTAISTCCNYYAMGGTTRTLGQVQEIVSALQEANKEEVWLQSLWCFQEGVLYSHPDRQPDVSGGVFRDHDGKTLKVVSPRLEGDLWDLVTVASTIGATIINILRYRAEAPTEDLFRDDPVTDPGIPVFQVWCFNPANEESARLMMDNLVRKLMALGYVHLSGSRLTKVSP